MDQLMVDVGDAPVEAGDEVVLIGRQGDAEITATEWARAPRHDLLRGRHRDRSARSPDVHRVR